MRLPDTAGARTLARELAPPALVRAVKRRHPHYSGVYGSFDAVEDQDPWSGAFWLRYSEQRLAKVRSAPWSTAPAGLRDAYAIGCLVVNQLAARGPCRVLDLGGGTGFVYFLIRGALTHPENVSWEVVDFGQLGALGRTYVRPGDRLSFSTEVPEGSFDVLYTNGMLQYLADYEAVLGPILAAADPEVCVLNRLVAGDIPDWVTRQTIGGRTTPCRLLNLATLLGWFAARGYAPEFVGAGKSLAHLYGTDIPERLRVHHEANVVLRRSPAPGRAQGMTST